MRLLIAALLGLWPPLAGLAQPLAQTVDDGPAQLRTGDEAAGWGAVGRLDIDGKGFCTATLIAPDLVLTAAHCLFERETSAPIGPERLQFLAGLRNGRALAYREVRRALVHPSYVHMLDGGAVNARWDLALIELAQPIRSTEVRPFAVSDRLAPDDRVGVVSYAADRAEAPALQQSCGIIGGDEDVILFTCDVDFGSSGAPVFRFGAAGAEIVSVVSAKANYGDQRVAIGMDLAQPLADLRAGLSDRSFGASPPGNAIVIRPGERNDTGARFVTVRPSDLP